MGSELSARHPVTVVGYQPEPHGADALSLAVLVARLYRSPLLVAAVHPPDWPVHGKGSADHELTVHLRDRAAEALDEARTRLPADIAATASVIARESRGGGRGLAELLDDCKAEQVVIGSAPGGPAGRIALGSTAARLLHGAPCAVFLAPDGYAERAPSGFDRITVAYRPTPECMAAVGLAASAAEALRAPLRLLTLIPGVYTGQPQLLTPAGLSTEWTAVRLIREQAEHDLAHQVAALRGDLDVESAVAVGPDVAGALAPLDFAPGELVMLASSTAGPHRRVFIGDAAMKIVRGVPCPVAVLPRTALRAA